MARGITENDVWNACDALLLEGARPTIERVRQKIGSGSPNTVSPFLETWFKHLGGRIKDPGAFSAPADVPDPVLAAAKHFWEAALAQTRLDFDQRLSDGLASAVANVEAEKDKAALAGAAAFEAASKAARLQSERDDLDQLLDSSRQELAAERARLQELRAGQLEAGQRVAADQARWAQESSDQRLQLEAAIGRADAADRRVALELERERSARSKSERLADTLQKSLDTAREVIARSVSESQDAANAARDREQNLKIDLAATVTDLALERQQTQRQRAAAEASAADAQASRALAASLQLSVDRLVALVEGAAQRHAPSSSSRRRAVKQP